MPTRIYALAKELKFDSKDLVDICAKAGITGKGSALASLEDDEVAKLKAYLRGPTKKAEAKPEAEKGISRQDYIAPPAAPKPIKVIQTPKKSALPVTPTVAEPLPVPVVETPPPPAEQEAPVTVAEAAPVAPPPTPPPAPVIEVRPAAREREPIPPKPDFDAPVRPTLPPPPTSAPEVKKSPPKRRAPVINVAPLPEVKQPVVKPKSSEPAPQKPDIRLPKDAISMSKRGDQAALAKQLSRAEEQAQKEKERLEKERLEKERDKGKIKGKERDGKEAKVEAPLSKVTRGRKGKPGEEEELSGMADMASLRKDRQKARKKTQDSRDTDKEEDVAPRKRTLVRVGHGHNTAAPRKTKVAVELPCTVRSLSVAAGVSSAEVMKALMKLGKMLNINARIDDDLVELVAAEMGLQLEFKQPESLEESLLKSIAEAPDDPDDLAPRPPVVTFLGHVDHGKTSLLDYLIGTKIVAGEAGGITQHIRAYQIGKDGRPISFVDTPGHEAFTEMRARGANVTDIAVLVIAADDGIMPQTEEAISHARAANVPIVVALNKIDLPNANANRVLTQMTEHGLTPSEWGGDVEVVQTSATKGTGMDQLQETLLGIAELNEYKANPKRAAVGVCLEAEQEGERGVIAKFMVKNGTLKVGDVVLCGTSFGRVKAMFDTLDSRKRLEAAGPSTPINVTGLHAVPQAGELFYVLGDIAQAREIAEKRLAQDRDRRVGGKSVKVSFEKFQELLTSGRLGKDDEVITLNLIIRADTRGSIEAIEKELAKLDHPEVRVRVLQRSVGGITVGDVMLAHASEAVIVGFNVIPDEAARILAEEKQVEFRRYDIIYKLTEDIKAMLEGKLKPEQRVVELGRALVKQVFSISRVGSVAGCYVAQGQIQRGCRIRVNRDGRTIGDYALESLRREKDDIREVPRGMECGLKLAGFNDVKKDDILEAYKIEEVARTL